MCVGGWEGSRGNAEAHGKGSAPLVPLPRGFPVEGSLSVFCLVGGCVGGWGFKVGKLSKSTGALNLRCQAVSSFPCCERSGFIKMSNTIDMKRISVFPESLFVRCLFLSHIQCQQKYT